MISIGECKNISSSVVRLLSLVLVVMLLGSLKCWAGSLKSDVLAIHNQFRKQHHAPNLVWDTTLQRYAENYAKQCIFQHSSPPYGENLAAGYASVTSAITSWYDEVAEYSYYWPGFSHRTGHFTQVVWVASKKVGCAYVACNGRHGTPGNYLVCEYSPAGNVVNAGYFKRNVLPE